MSKLYELTNSYTNLLELLDNKDVPAELVVKSLGEVKEEIEDKAENIAKLIKMLEVDIEGYRAEELRLQVNRKSLENKVDSLKDYLEESMKAIGKTKFKGKLFSFNIQKNAPSLDIESMDHIPGQYLIEQEPKLDKKALLKDIKEGLEIIGVQLKQTESLRIR